MKSPFTIKILIKTLIFILCLFIINELSAQPGSLDKSFGNEGLVLTTISKKYASIASLAVQSDNKIVAAGYSYLGKDYTFTLARYDTNGQLDSSFGKFGVATTIIDSGHSSIRSLNIQEDGKLVVAGYAGTNFNDNFALARFNADGSLDMSFGNNGTVITSFGALSLIFSSAIQIDGKIIVVGCMGSAFSPGGNVFALARYNLNGTADSTFGINGKITTSIRNIDDIAYSVCIQTDGKIIVAGGSYHSENSNITPDVAIARYNSNGTLDSTFGTDGITITSILQHSHANKINILEDNKILVSGIAYNGNKNEFMLARYTSNGLLDATFGINGVRTCSFGQNDDISSSSIVQPDNKIVLVGFSFNNLINEFALARFNGNGSFDSTFGVNGIITTQIDSSDSYLFSTVLQQDGKLLVGGKTYINDTTSIFIIARYISGLNLGIDKIANTNSVLFYPNPIQRSSFLEYSLNNNEPISIKLIDLQGRLIKTYIDNQFQSAGKHREIITLPESIPSGSYNLVLTTANTQSIIKIIKQ